MQIITYWKRGFLENYANFKGRDARPEFWWFYLANVILTYGLFILGGISGASILGLIGLLYGLAVIVPGIAAGVRRLHDTGKSGWLMLVSAFAPRIPLLFAVLPPVVFAVLQIWIDFLKTFTFKDNLFGVIGEWFANSPLILSGDAPEGSGPGAAFGIPITDTFDHAVTIGNMLDRLFSYQMFIGLVITSICMAGALYLRHRATDN